MSKQRPVVVVFVGSLRKASTNRQLARALEKLAGDRAEFRYARLDNLPSYNQDFDANYPAECTALKDTVKAGDAVLFVTPENNRSIPGILKNAMDIASRPWGKNAFAGKPGGVIGTSVSGIATALAQQHLRNVCAYLDIYMMAQPEAFIRHTDGNISDDGTINDDKLRETLGTFVDRYLQWIGNFL